MNIVDEVNSSLDKCIHNKELIELLDEQITACQDTDKLQQLQECLNNHVNANDAIFTALSKKLRAEIEKWKQRKSNSKE